MHIKLILGALVLMATTALADSTITPIRHGGYRTIPRKTSTDTPVSRPRIPAISDMALRYDYDRHVLEFDMPDYVTAMTVSVEHPSEGIVEYAYVESGDPSLEVNLEGSTYYIECVTDGGAVYGGTFDF